MIQLKKSRKAYKKKKYHTRKKVKSFKLLSEDIKKENDEALFEKIQLKIKEAHAAVDEFNAVCNDLNNKIRTNRNKHPQAVV